MSKTDWFVILGLLILLGFIGFFSQYVYEERNPLPCGERENTISNTLNAIRITHNEITSMEVTMTAYSPDKSQCQGNPFETASGLIVNPQGLRERRYVAISRDLWKLLKEEYNFQWGDSIYVEVFVVDLMGEKAQGEITKNTIDWFMETELAAIQFGNQVDRKIIILEE